MRNNFELSTCTPQLTCEGIYFEKHWNEHSALVNYFSRPRKIYQCYFSRGTRVILKRNKFFIHEIKMLKGFLTV